MAVGIRVICMNEQLCAAGMLLFDTTASLHYLEAVVAQELRCDRGVQGSVRLQWPVAVDATMFRRFTGVAFKVLDMAVCYSMM
jgi:hypothetical protein